MVTAKDTIIDTEMNASKVLVGKGSPYNVASKVNGDVANRIAANSGKDIIYLDKKYGGRLHNV